MDCFSGPAAAPDPACEDADLDGDADVDLTDLLILLTAFTGSI